MTEILSLELVKNFVESAEEFPVDFDDAWRWIGYTRKDTAKDLLESNFGKGFDFSGEFRKNSKRGRPVEKIFLTVTRAVTGAAAKLVNTLACPID